MKSPVVFDMDGTLIDSAQAVPAAYIGLLEDLRPGYAITPEDVYARYPLGPPPLILADLLGRPPTVEELESFHSRLADAAAMVACYSGVQELLDTLARRAVPLAVFTGADTRSATTLLSAVGLVSRFVLVLGSEGLAHPKPAPDGLELAARELRVHTRDLTYVGDSPLDQACAVACGARAIAAGWGHLFVGPQPGAAVADTPADVLRHIA